VINKRKLYIRSACLLLCLVMFVSASVAACAAGQPFPPCEKEYLVPPTPPETESPQIEIPRPSFTDQIAEMHGRNSDTVGWLFVPNTSIDDVVVHYPHDANEFYLRRNFDRRSSFSGVYFADFRNTFDGTASGLSRNTVIYGHSLNLNDDPDAPYFDQLKRFLSEDFARANPYIFFSVAGEDLVWEIFAVYYATDRLPYNQPNFTDEEFLAMLLEMTKRSEFIYDVEVGLEDRILTLSTCTYVFTPGVYPNKFRFVISARLVGEGEALRETAVLTRNPSPKDP